MSAAARLIFDPETRLIGVRTGKVELGQHVHDAYVQIVAQTLGVDACHVHVCPVTTSQSPDDGMTVGSVSIQVTGQAIAQEVAELEQTLRGDAARRMNVAVGDASLDASTLIYASGMARCDLFELARALDLTGNVALSLPLIEQAITGQRMYLQDMVLPDMIHARALRGRSSAPIRDMLTDDIQMIEDGGFAAVLAASDADLRALWAGFSETIATGSRSHDGPVTDWIKTCAISTETSGTAKTQVTSVAVSRPFLLHGSIAPSCAIAQLKEDRLTVWTHSQGMQPLRTHIARMVGLEPDHVDLRHIPSAGTYGHSGADDAAADAAMIAMHVPGQPVRVAWPREDEARHGPVGAPMLVEASATLDVMGQITSWHQEIWSGSHGQRPGGGGSINLLSAMERDPSLRPTSFADLPAKLGSGAGRNGTPIYTIPDVAATTHIVQDMPVRTSSLRGLGAQMNTVAIEAMMDKLAAQAGEDPIDFRVRHLEDPRALVILDQLRAPLAIDLEEDEGIGIALGRYKNKAAYVGVAAKVKLEDAPRVLDLWAFVDAGQVVSRSGALNQVEGGMIQATSWTLCEGVMLRDGVIDAKGWAEYPTLGWDGVPRLHVTLADDTGDHPPLGVGECMVGPTSAAIVNAVSACLGQPLAHLPLNRDMLIKALSA